MLSWTQAHNTFAIYFVYNNTLWWQHWLNSHNPQNWTQVIIPLFPHTKAGSHPLILFLFLSQTLYSRQDSYWSQTCAQSRVLAHIHALSAAPAASPHYQMLQITSVISVTNYSHCIQINMQIFWEYEHKSGDQSALFFIYTWIILEMFPPSTKTCPSIPANKNIF